MALRAYLYRKKIIKSHTLPVPVISVGNLTMGGTGKTPLVMYLARLLLSRGYKPAVVSRGYRGRSKASVNLVSDGSQILMNALESGDEPWLLANELSGVVVATGKHRWLPCKEVIENYNCDIIILDDGFQHLKIQRTIDLVLFDVDVFAGNSRVFPGGELRESVSALNRCDAFILTGINKSNQARANKCSALLTERFKGKEIFELSGAYQFALRYDYLEENKKCKEISLDELPNHLLCFCGIANPQRFKQLLNEHNIPVSAFKLFQDHHHYSPAEINQLVTEARTQGANGFLTTEKDISRIQNLSQFEAPIFTLPFEFKQNPEFNRFIERVIFR